MTELQFMLASIDEKLQKISDHMGTGPDRFNPLSGKDVLEVFQMFVTALDLVHQPQIKWDGQETVEVLATQRHFRSLHDYRKHGPHD